VDAGLDLDANLPDPRVGRGLGVKPALAVPHAVLVAIVSVPLDTLAAFVIGADALIYCASHCRDSVSRWG
jgi:hypothetical protein